MNTNLKPKLAIWLYTEEKAFGPGIAELLERVKEHRSLRAAAISMEMAYSKAWTIVRRCEQALGCKLLETTTGGIHGGGAAPTAEAEELLAAYRRYCVRLREAAEQLWQEELA